MMTPRTILPLPALGFLLIAGAQAQLQLRELGKLDHLAADRDATRAVVLVDIDGDRRLDVVTKNTDSIRVFLGDGRGVFAERTAARITHDRGNVAGLVAGDLDQDGDVDLVHFTWTVNRDTTAKLLLNDGAGNLRQFAGKLPAVLRVSALALGDVDADGDLDLFIGGGTGGAAGQGQRNRLLLNDGKATFREVDAGRFPTDTDNTTAAAFVDVDGDKALDLIIGNTQTYLGPPAQNKLYLGDGKGGFREAPPGSLPKDLTAACDIAVGDIDRDGDQDFVVANALPQATFGTRSVHVYTGDGKGRFTETTPAPFPTVSCTGVELVDVNADSNLDLVAAHSSAKEGGLRLYTGDGKGGFQESGRGLRDRTASNTALAVADVDGNGLLDFVTGSNLARNQLFLGTAKLVWLDVTEPRRFGVARSTFRLKFQMPDLNGDGDPDLVENGVTTPLQVSLADGEDRYRDVTSTHVPALPAKQARDFHCADVDGDGDVDVLVSLETGGTARPLRILRNDGTGKMSLAPETDLPFKQTLLDISVADLDRDGRPDLLIDTYGPPTIFRGGAGGKFTADTRSTWHPKGLRPHALGDLDGDRDLDVLFKTNAHLPSDEFEIYLNDGKGVFTYRSSIKITLNIITDVLLVDVDGDRDLDFVAQGPWIWLFLNDGAGKFTEASSRLPVPRNNWYKKLHFADWDGDGDQDVVVSASIVGRGDDLTYWQNTAGTFHDVTTSRLGGPLVLPEFLSSSTVDYDADGDPDLAWASGLGKHTLFNLTRHTHIPHALRLGAPVTIRLWNRPGSSEVQFALVQLAAADANWLIPPFGRLKVDLATLLLLPPVVIPAGGRADVVLPAPNDAGLLGLRLHTQSLVIGPIHNPLSGWRYTNLAVAPALFR